MYVYRNLNKACWSIKADRKAKVSHADAVILAAVTFKVSEKRRQAVIKQKQREVHAWAIGTLTYSIPFDSTADWTRITYRPYDSGSFFIVATGESIASARFVRFDADGSCWAIL